MKARQQKFQSAQEFMHAIIHTVYPELFGQLNSVIAEIQLLPADDNTLSLGPLAEDVCHQMDELHKMEKQTLFPFITILAEENRQTDSCKLFKNTKAHYTAMLKGIHQLKTALKKCDEQDSNVMLIDDIRTSLEDFEKQHIFLQVTKDKYLFAQFKSCSGCKSLPE